MRCQETRTHISRHDHQKKKKTYPVSPSLCRQFRARMTALPKQQGHIPKASLDALPVAARETPAPLFAWTFLPLPLSLHWRHSRHLPPRPPLPTVPTEGTVSPAFPPSRCGWHPRVHAESSPTICRFVFSCRVGFPHSHAAFTEPQILKLCSGGCSGEGLYMSSP